MSRVSIGDRRVRIIDQANAVVIAFDAKNVAALTREIEQLAELLDAYDDTMERRQETRTRNGLPVYRELRRRR